MVDYIIWDMDGTILNTLDDLADSVNYVLSLNGMKNRTIDEIRSFVGNGIPKLIERAIPTGIDEKTTEKCLEEMLTYYKTHSKIKTAPYEGILDAMDEFKKKGIGMAVVTNKEQSAAQKLTAELFGDYLNITVGAGNGLKFKPEPDGVFKAMELLCVNKESKVIYIGDSEVDVLTAHNSSLKCIGVLWGFRSREVLEENHCDFIVNDVDELKNLVFSL